MKKVRFFPVLIAVLLFSSPAFAQELWRGTTYGMSVDQVRAAIPGAATPTSKPDTLEGGHVELLRLGNVEIVNNRFSARFYFKQGSLTQVTLTLGEGQTFGSAMIVFDNLTDALRAKYGRELNRKVQRGILNMATAEWLSGRTNINLIAMCVGDKDAILNINYQVRLAKEADKL